MISALYRYPKRERRAVASRWGKRGAASRAAARLAQGVDAETLHRRALHDRRGRLVRAVFGARGCVEVRHSFAGRTDQFDVLVDGSLWRTCGPRRLPDWLR